MIVSIYDMDRTLTRRGTWIPWLQFWLRTQAPWRVVMVPLMVVPGVAYATRLIDRGKLKAWGHRLLMGPTVSRRRVEAAAKVFAREMVANEVFPAARTALAQARDAGHRLVLATASNAYYVRAIGAELGITDIIASESRWRGDVLHPWLDDDNCYGAAKALQVAGWLGRNGLADAEVRFFSDHLSDLPSFELAEERGGEAVAVNPSPALRAEATRRGWQIVDWGVPAKSLFERA
ncbi:HAD superfamily phosphoserine phosphatase-like hydrolase [Polymorphobacter fuscus]|uniref:HAD family hydrolase n=1 Tax=Sandarakinorhabdus fusca TaxID=1439888 RepID=UPI00142F3F31|nr:HAD-IB family phosphatase [Polymorphobacter fuscus]NJC07110.1 HAD superfamily phosphoserine phosphatase-like hydrolase [Polymorphobacter fuscus]